MILLHVGLDRNSEEGRYFLACARIRDLSPQALLKRLFDTISQDQLVGSVLDDADEMRRRIKSEHRHAGPQP